MPVNLQLRQPLPKRGAQRLERIPVQAAAERGDLPSSQKGEVGIACSV